MFLKTDFIIVEVLFLFVYLLMTFLLYYTFHSF